MTPIETYNQLSAEFERVVTAREWGSTRCHELLDALAVAWGQLTLDEQVATEAAMNKRLNIQPGSPVTVVSQSTTMTTSMALWMEHGPAWVKEFPALSQVEITDLKPAPIYPIPVHYTWRPDGFQDGFNSQGGRGVIPHVVYLHLATSGEAALRYRSEREAVDALSDACLAWARSQR